MDLARADLLQRYLMPIVDINVLKPSAITAPIHAGKAPVFVQSAEEFTSVFVGKGSSCVELMSLRSLDRASESLASKGQGRAGK